MAGSVTFYVVSQGRVAQNSMLSKGLLFVPVLFCGLSFTVQTYDLVFPGHFALIVVAWLLYYAAILSFFVVQGPWYWTLWKHFQQNKTLGNEEQKESVYMLAMLFYMVACTVVTAVFGWPYAWTDTGENILIGYIVVQILCILLATVLPTMFMRKVVQVSSCWFACPRLDSHS